MKLAAKTRYALASMLVMASDTTGQTRFTVSYLADVYKRQTWDCVDFSNGTLLINTPHGKVQGTKE